MVQSSQFPHLFKPLTIRAMELRNRIVMLPMHLRLDPTTEQARKFYRARAQGGGGAIITWATVVDLVFSDEAWGEPGAAKAFMDALKPLIEQVHQAGARIGMQLSHYNAYPPVLPFSCNWLKPITGNEKCEWVAPSARVEPADGVHGGAPPQVPLRELTVPEIESIVRNFGRAAEGAKRAGFDFVEVHSAHGTLPCQFFSPIDNVRTDAYGGDLQRRMRFGLDCVTAMREAVGQDFPIFFRPPGSDIDTPAGISIDDGVAFAIALEKVGVDCFNVSVGTAQGRPYWQIASPGPKAPPGTWVHLAEAIKRNVQVPVIGVGKINTPDLAERILAEGKADLIGVGRQLIADPQWPNKARQGRLSEIIACTSCNLNCWAGIGGDLPLNESLCKENPEAGSYAE